MKQIFQEHAIKCNYEQSGSLMVATTQAQVRRVENELRIIDSWKLEGFEAWDETRLAEEFQTGLYRRGLYQDHSALLNPALLARELMRISQEAGAMLKRVESDKTVPASPQRAWPLYSLRSRLDVRCIVGLVSLFERVSREVPAAGCRTHQALPWGCNDVASDRASRTAFEAHSPGTETSGTP